LRSNKVNTLIMTNPKYLIQLDGLRTFAVGLVIFSHYATLSSINSLNAFFGAAGVTLFFVLSGFLITSILISNKEHQETEGYSNGFILRQFYARRFVRIFPLYYLVIFVGIAINIPGARTNLTSLITYTANWMLPHQGDLKSYSHMWSLGVEEQFYILFPVAFVFIDRKYILKMLIAMVVLAIISRAMIIITFFADGNEKEVNWSAHRMTPACFDSFGFGSILAYLKFYYPIKTVKFLKKQRLWIFALLLTAGSLALWTVNSVADLATIVNALLNRTIISLASMYVIGIASFSLFSGNIKRFLENNVVVYFGKISYGIYVYHYIIMYLFDSFSPTSSATLNIALGRISCILLTVALASVSWAIFEKPFNDLKRYFPYAVKKKNIESSKLMTDQAIMQHIP
jgi:peptidoglycan/LPS O-acetylase OafA/YrhL